MKQLPICALIFMLLIGQSAQTAGAATLGNELQEWCTHSFNDTDQSKGNHCTGFLQGVSEFHDALVGLGLLDQLWCKPDVVQDKQLEELILKYLESNPDRLQLEAADSVWFALGENFRC